MPIENFPPAAAKAPLIAGGGGLLIGAGLGALIDAPLKSRGANAAVYGAGGAALALGGWWLYSRASGNKQPEGTHAPEGAVAAAPPDGEAPPVLTSGGVPFGQRGLVPVGECREGDIPGRIRVAEVYVVEQANPERRFWVTTVCREHWTPEVWSAADAYYRQHGGRVYWREGERQLA